jgi:Hint module
MSRFMISTVYLICLVVSVSGSIPIAVRHEGHDHSSNATSEAPSTMAGTPTVSGQVATASLVNGTSSSSQNSTTVPSTTAANSSTSGRVTTASLANGTSSSTQNSSCFPAEATVTTSAGIVKRMHELVVGDYVHVGRGKLSKVFMFTHKTLDISAEFVVIDAAFSRARLHLTPGHYMYVNGGLAAAKTVVAGDAIELADGSVDVVSSVSSAVLKGLYNPQTLHGDIVVDNVRVSTFTTAVEPAFAHAILSPLRAAFRILGFSTSLFEDGSDLVSVLPSGSAAF